MLGFGPAHRFVSIRSLHRSIGRLPGRKVMNALQVVSIRSLHQSTGRFLEMAGGCSPSSVSIRSLHQSTGRSQPLWLWTEQAVCFNPLPAPEYREIYDSIHHRAEPYWFQSAPCTRVQGDTHHTEHRPLRRYPGSFQSAPCTRVQGDHVT